MNEEEIIKVCNKLINDFSHFQEIRIKDRELGLYSWNCYDDVLAEYRQAIQGLLDLYNKEKEKNTLLEQEREYLNCIIESDEDNYISKDKIREKIEKLNNEMLNENNSLELFYRKKYCKEVLEELLKENE